METSVYILGLGSNRWHGRYGSPARAIAAAIDTLAKAGLAIEASSALHCSRALGPGGREFANAAVLARTALGPPALLALAKRIERGFGRRRGRRWGARVLDIDILAWSGGRWSSRTLTVPHTELMRRGFALGPAAAIAPGWRHPRSGLSLRQAEARRRRARPVDRDAPTS